MRILHVVPGLAPRMGGPSFAVVEAASSVRRLGHDTAIFTTDMAEPAGGARRRLVEPVDAGAVRVEYFETRRPWRLAYAPSLARALEREIRVFDVVHVHSLFLFPVFAAARAARAAGVPCVIAPCGALDPWLRRNNRVVKAVNDRVWQRRALDEAAMLHFKTEAEQRLVADLELRAPGVVVPNAIDLAPFATLPDRGEFRRRFLGGYEGTLVLNVGRIARKKGLDVLVDAVARLRRDGLSTKLVLAGPDDEGLSGQLAERARSAAVDLELVGMLDLDAKLAALAAADVWVLPSHTENFGQAALEAMAAGVPCVLSDAVNLAEEAAEADAVRVVRPEQESVAEGIRAILESGPLATRLSEHGRRFAARYESSAVARRLVQMYEAAIERRAGLAST